MKKSISLLGSGWLGFPLGKQLINNSYEVKISTTTKNRLSELEAAGLKSYLIDINSLTENIQSFLKSKILIINITSKIVDSFNALINELKKSTIENVIFISSTSVYGNSEGIVRESDGKELHESPIYKIEELFRASDSLKTTILRFGGLIGYNRNPGNFFASGRKIISPESPVNLIHRDDCIGIITKIIEKGIWGEVFNCCADTHPTKKEFYTYAAKCAGNPIPEFDYSENNKSKIISNEKVKKYLGYDFIYSNLMKIEF
jgi:nucleoside-diphosphate-sugar epimerase